MRSKTFPKMTLVDAVTEFPNLKRTGAAILVALNDAKGRVILKQTLREAAEAVTGTRSSEMGLSSNIQRIRKAIKGAGRIESITGVGYKLIWDEPAPLPPSESLSAKKARLFGFLMKGAMGVYRFIWGDEDLHTNQQPKRKG